MDLYRDAVRPLLFRLDAETSHRATLRAAGALAHSRAALGAFERRFAIRDPRLRTKGYGRRFLASLPPAPVVQDLTAIEKFFLTEPNRD